MSEVGSAACGALSRLSAALPVDPATLSDGQLVRLAEDLAAAHRHLGALDLAVAGEVERRSDPESPSSLAKRLGFKTAAAALQNLTKSSGKEAQKLVTQVTDLKQLPAVEAAVLDGRIGRDAAAAISGELKRAAATADTAELTTAQTELVELAVAADADEVKARAAETAARLSVHMVEDAARKAMKERYFWVGPTVDGVAKVSGLLPAGHAAVVRGLFDAFVNPKGKKTVAFQPANHGGSERAPSDERTAGQKRADLLRDVCASQARSAESPDMGGDHPTVWLSTTVAELHSGTGLAFYAGTAEPVPVAEAAQAACTGGSQTVVFAPDGDVLRLGRDVRGFTKRQRRAIALRDGGTCLIPGCTVPAQWCEVHHVVPYKDGGPTDVCNGVLLCWYHHHDIDSGPWHIRMRNGTPEVRYAAAGKALDWQPAGDGAATRIRAGAPPGAPPND